jgi:polyisoprenoid-binding protein YceI
MLSRPLSAAMIALVSLAATAAGAQQLEEYAVDAGHSIVEFSIPFAFTRVKGRFTDWHGTVLYDRANPANSSISVVIEAKSIDTGWPHRDEHLRTSDFFDVDRLPTIVFQSDHLRPAPDGWIADGRLTMHGVTRNVSIPFQLLGGGPRRSPESGWLILDAVASARLDRADFGITGGSKYNSWFDAARAATMGDTVSISLEVEGWWADPASERSAAIDAALARIKNGGIQSQITRLQQARDSAHRGRTLAGAPGPAWPAYYRGADLTLRALIADGRAADAVALGGAMVSLFDNWQSFVVHGYALAVAGNDREAVAEFARAKTRYSPPPPSNEKFKQDDEEWWWLNQLALNGLARGQQRPALQLARLLTELYPTQPRAFVTLGRVLLANGDERASGDAFAEALRLDPNETRAMEWIRRVRR